MLQRASSVVAEQLVTDTNRDDEPYEFFEPAGRYTVTAIPGPHAEITVRIEAGKTAKAVVASTCI